MLGYFVMSGIAYVCAKYISSNLTGGIKLFFAHFASSFLSWLLGGFIALMVTSIFADIAHNAVPVFFSRGLWWTVIGMFFGIYMGNKAKNKSIDN